MAPYNLKIPDGPFTTVAADPPWPFKDKLPGPGRGAAKHYDVMSLDDIKDMRRRLVGGLFCRRCGIDLQPGEHGCRENYYEPSSGEEHIPGVVTQEAHLYLWAPNAFVHDAWEVAEAWGFEPRTVLTWVKVTAHAAYTVKDHIPQFVNGWEALNMSGVTRMGMGRGYRNVTEQVVVATRGKAPMIRTNQPNVFFAPRRGHSEKPNIFYDIVESMSPGPRLELFAGRERPGWTCLVPPKGDADNG